MRTLFCGFFLFFTTSCSITHDLKIPKQPCLYPDTDYNFILCEDFKFKINSFNFIIPKGFETDLASIPRILWPIYSPNKANTIAAAVIHDYFYLCPVALTREQADTIFFDVLIYNGASKLTAFKYWLAVRAFGSSYYHEGAICNYVNA